MHIDDTLKQNVINELEKRVSFRLKFPDELEKEFLDYYFVKMLPYIKFSLRFGLIIYFLFGLLDYLLYPNVVQLLWAIRYGVGSLFIVWALTQFEWVESDSTLEFVQAFNLFVVGLSIIAMLSYLTFDETQKYYAGVMIVTFYIYVASGLRLKYSMAAGLMLALSYIIAAFTVLDTGNTYITNNVFFLASANVIGILSSALSERALRRDFLMSYFFYIQSIEVEKLNDQLMELSRTDELTHLANRRYFHEMAERSWSEMVGTDTPISLLMIDIDYFKLYNDMLGHQAGDRCLSMMGEILKGFERNRLDLAVRYGGEEFLLILSGTTNDEALEIATRLKDRVFGMKIPHPGSGIADFVTVSIGVATLVPSDTNDISDLIKAADEALYRAKAAGRNCVVNAGDLSAVSEL